MAGRTRENCTRFLTGGRTGTQGTNFTGKTKQWESKEPLPAVLTTFSGAFIPEVPQKQKNQSHTPKWQKWKLIWTGFETSQGFFTASTRPTTDWHRESKTTSTHGDTANPKCPTCSRAGRCKRGEVAPVGKATLVGLQDKLQLTTLREDRRDTLGDHVIPSQKTQQPDPDKLPGKARGQEEKQWTRVDLDTRFLGSHWVQALLTLDQGLGLEGHRSTYFCITRNSALWCAVLHSLIEVKEHLCLIFPCF